LTGAGGNGGGMKTMGFAGWSGSGKTTLLIKLIPVLTRRGVRVSTIKHAHHGFDIERPGKDSHQHREAGADEVLISSGKRWALMHENRGEDEADLDQLLARLSPVDLVLIEGFRNQAHAKIEVYRSDLGKPLLCPDDPHVIAVATDAHLAGTHLPVLDLPILDLNDIEAVAEFIVEHRELAVRAA
jgi:molybdopterin-guanine dinucleotide biosynthesis protein B